MQDNWYNLYGGSWMGIIPQESFAHPAKYSQKLIYRIYQHIKEQGWADKGSNILDPFAGVGLGALYAMTSGMNWTGFEIEPRFHALAQGNIDYWNKKYKSLEIGNGEVVLGDSRLAVFPDSHLVLSSPPYAETRLNHDGIEGAGHNDSYGRTTGQLGAMKSGYDISVSSPPYGDISQSGGTKGLIERGVGLTGGERCFGEYGDTSGQLGRMKMEDLSSDTFWGAARQIVINVFNSLVPGGHAVWVVKDYIKNRQVVPFCEQWRELCESCGFVTLHEHRCWVVTKHGTSISMDGKMTEIKKEYKSFFRKLNESKGLPPIDYEIVWCMEKPIEERKND